MIILTIIKWIGIVLLSLLGLILLILALVLFYPFLYRISVDDKDIYFKLSYFSRLLSARAEFVAGKLNYNVKVLWKTIIPKGDDTDEKKKKPISRKSDGEKTKEESNLEKTVNEPDPRADKSSINESSEKGVSQNKEENRKKPKKSIGQMFGGLKRKIIVFFDNTVYKAGRLIDNYNKYTDDLANRTYSYVLKQLVILLKHIRPRRGGMNFTLGFEDPSTTGYILAVYSMVYPKLGRRFRLHPDFENALYSGEGKICGHLQLYVLLIILLRLYFNKDIKKFLDRR